MNRRAFVAGLLLAPWAPMPAHPNPGASCATPYLQTTPPRGPEDWLGSLVTFARANEHLTVAYVLLHPSLGALVPTMGFLVVEQMTFYIRAMPGATAKMTAGTPYWAIMADCGVLM